MAQTQPTMFEGGINDPGLYRKLCEPFAGPAEAREAVEAFCQRVRELRIMYGIPELYVGMEVNILVPAEATEPSQPATPGKLPEPVPMREEKFLAKLQAGDSLKSVMLLARLLGAERQAQSQALATLTTAETSVPIYSLSPEEAVKYATEQIRLSDVYNKRAKNAIDHVDELREAIRKRAEAEKAANQPAEPSVTPPTGDVPPTPEEMKRRKEVEEGRGGY